jgi:hypothetical protein
LRCYRQHLPRTSIACRSLAVLGKDSAQAESLFAH